MAIIGAAQADQIPAGSPGESHSQVPGPDRPRRVTILGSTGSIGQSTVDLLLRNRDAFTVEALTAHHNTALLAQQAKALNELELALASYRGALSKLETAGQLLAAEERQLRSVDALFKAGENDRLTLVSAQVELQAARLSRLEALIETLQALGALEEAAGLLLTP